LVRILPSRSRLVFVLLAKWAPFGNSNQCSVVSWLHEVEEQVEQEDDEDVDADTEQKGYLIYGSKNKLMEAFSRGDAISVVIAKDGSGEMKYYSCCKGGKLGQVATQLEVSGERRYDFGLWYQDLSIVEQEDDHIDWEEVAIAKYAVFLPQEKNEDGDSRYALITSDWTCLGEGGGLVFPHHAIIEHELKGWREK